MSESIETNFLHQAFAGRGLLLQIQDGWLLQDGGFPALRAVWRQDDGARVGRLDVSVVLSETQTVEECFAGLGSGAGGRIDALRNFLASAFPVLLAAVWNRVDSEQVRVEEWTLGNRRWSAYLGHLGVRNFGPQILTAPAGFAEAIADGLQGEALEPGFHWARIVYCNATDGSVRVEALLDNQPWAAGADVVAQLPWTRSADLYTVRAFLMLKQAAN